MPRSKSPCIPTCTEHKASGRAVVRLNGRDHYLGPYGTPEAAAAYERRIAEWLARGRRLAPETDVAETTIEEVLARYWVFAEQHYRKRGEPTKELDNIRYALRPLRSLYGETPASHFGPLALKALRVKMIESGLSRKVINQRIGKIKRVFRWATSEQLIPPAVYQALATVDGLQRDRTEARETEPIGPVADVVVDATLPHLPPVVADMVRFERLTGARPSEVCLLRPCDVDRSEEPWLYRPESHKTEHHGRQRIIFVGPRAQAVLLPYLLRDSQAHCFSPAESQAARRAERRANRKTKVQPSQLDRRKAKPKRTPGARYNRNSYLHAIRRASAKAGVPFWAPNQLRHSVGTELRKRYDLESARVVLGHSKADTTAIYAERDLAKAAEIMREVG